MRSRRTVRPLDPPRALLSWSSGKDSAYALSVVRDQGLAHVEALVTTVDERTGRVPVHGVSQHLLQCQAAALGLPLWTIEIPWPCPDAVYRTVMAEMAQRAAGEGMSRIVFGDLFLADIRSYREDMLSRSGIEPLFPLWGWNTTDLAGRMLDAGINATITCIDRTRLNEDSAGTQYDRKFLERLGPGVDPCGENGEFHTFVWDGPGFAGPIVTRVGDMHEEGPFVIADIVPTSDG